MKLKDYSTKRINQKILTESITNGDFPIINEEHISLIEYFKSSLSSEDWFINLSENGKYGALCCYDSLIKKLSNIKSRMHNEINDDE